MAESHSETGDSRTFRNKSEPTIQDGQTSGSTKKALKPTDAFAENSPDPDDAPGNPDDPGNDIEKFWKTDKFRNRSSIGLICLLLGIFGFVCYQRYRNRIVREESITEVNVEKQSGEQGQISSEAHTPQPLTDLSQNLVLPTPIAKSEDDPPSMNDGESTEPIDEPTATEPVKVTELKPDTQDPIDRNPFHHQVTATPVSKGKIDDPFEEEASLTKSQPESEVPSIPNQPQQLTKLHDIESDEPAKLDGIQPDEKAESTNKLNDKRTWQDDQFADFGNTPPPSSSEGKTPLTISEPETNEFERHPGGFREVKVDSRHSTGKTKVFSSETPGLQKGSGNENSGDADDSTNRDRFEQPEPSRNDQNAIRKTEPAAGPLFDDETFPPTGNPSITSVPSNGPAGNFEGDIYTVRPRDTYWRISKQHYGTVRYFLALARYNQDQVPDPRLMKPGTMIRVPPADVLEQLFPDLLPKTKLNGRTESGTPRAQYFMDAGTPKYRVAPSDNLSVISGRYLGDESRWDEIYQLNQELLQDANRVPVGTILSLPSSADPRQMDGERVEYR